MVDFFKPPTKYPRDHPTKNINSDTSDDGDDNVIVVNDEERNSNNYKLMIPTSMVNIIRTHIIDSQVTKGCDEENDDKTKMMITKMKNCFILIRWRTWLSMILSISLTRYKQVRVYRRTSLMN